MLACLALAYGKALDAVVIDSHRPNSHDALVRAWSTGDDARALRYEQPLQTALPEVLAEAGRRSSSRATRARTSPSRLLPCAAAKADFCVMPCCQRPPTSVKTATHELKIPSTVAMDLGWSDAASSSATRCTSSSSTRRSRRRIGSPAAAGRARAAAASFLPHEARLQKTYDRVHGRRRAPPPLAKARRRRLPWAVLALAALPVLLRLRMLRR